MPSLLSQLQEPPGKRGRRKAEDVEGVRGSFRVELLIKIFTPKKQRTLESPLFCLSP
jgi:hypothetical protein